MEIIYCVCGDVMSKFEIKEYGACTNCYNSVQKRREIKAKEQKELDKQKAIEEEKNKLAKYIEKVTNDLNQLKGKEVDRIELLSIDEDGIYRMGIHFTDGVFLELEASSAAPSYDPAIPSIETYIEKCRPEKANV